MLADFEAGLRGARTGEQKTIDVAFPQTYPVATLAGKKASFSVSVKSVEERRLPNSTRNSARHTASRKAAWNDCGRKSKRMKRELADAIRARLKKQVMDGILAANPLELPRTMVDAQVRELQIDAARRMGARDASQVPPPDAFQDAARRRVGLTLLIGEVVKQAGLRVNQSQVQVRFERRSAISRRHAGAADLPEQSAVAATDGGRSAGRSGC